MNCGLERRRWGTTKENHAELKIIIGDAHHSTDDRLRLDKCQSGFVCTLQRNKTINQRFLSRVSLKTCREELDKMRSEGRLCCGFIFPVHLAWRSAANHFPYQ
jgi:hypothetical protein